MPRIENGSFKIIRVSRGSIPYTLLSRLFRNKIAKSFKEQLLTHSNPRNPVWNDACEPVRMGVLSCVKN
jgi:hypothetical protein